MLAKGPFTVPGVTSFCRRPTYIRRLSVREGVRRKLQALVYDLLAPTTAVFSYAIGSRKLSANEHFLFFCFVGAQTVVRLLQATQIISDVVVVVFS